MLLEGGGKISAGSVPLKVLKERSRCWRKVHCEMPDGRLPERLLLERSSQKRVPQWSRKRAHQTREVVARKVEPTLAKHLRRRQGTILRRTLREMLR